MAVASRTRHQARDQLEQGVASHTPLTTRPASHPRSTDTTTGLDKSWCGPWRKSRPRAAHPMRRQAEDRPPDPLAPSPVVSLNDTPSPGREAPADLPQALPHFCLPRGVHLRADCAMPTVHEFALTDAEGRRMYGCCLVVWEHLQGSLLVQASLTLQFPHICHKAFSRSDHRTFFAQFAGAHTGTDGPKGRHRARRCCGEQP